MNVAEITNLPTPVIQSQIVPLNPYHELESRIASISHRSFEPTDTLTIKAAIRLAHGWTWPAGRMKRFLEQLPPETIRAFVMEILKNGADQEIDYFVQKSLSFLDQNMLLNLSQIESHEDAAYLYKAKATIRESVLGQRITRECWAILKEFWVEVKHFFHHIMEIVISMTGLNVLKREKHSRWGGEGSMDSWVAKNKLDSYQALASSPAVIFGMIFAYINLKAAAIALTSVAIVGALVAVVAYQRYWKPCPIDHEGLKNLSISTLRKHDPIYPRQDILNQIQSAFESGKGVLLVGKPGSGKTALVNSFVQQLAAGKSCPFIKNPQVFTRNSAGIGGIKEELSLNAIESRFQPFSNQVIFFFDEFHSLFISDTAIRNTSGDEMKTFCEDFKYVIGATTEEEYHKYIEGKTAIIDRRFVKIDVGQLEDDKITISMSQFMDVMHPELEMSDNVLEYVIKKSSDFNPNTSTIDSAHSLLMQAIRRMSNIGFQALEKQITDYNDQIGVVTRNIQNNVAGNLEAHMNELGRLKTLVAPLELELAQKKERVKVLKKMEALCLQLKRESYKLAQPEVDLEEGSALERTWLELHTRIQILRDTIKQERTALGLPVCMDESLIDQIVLEKQSKRKAEAGPSTPKYTGVWYSNAQPTS